MAGPALPRRFLKRHFRQAPALCPIGRRQPFAGTMRLFLLAVTCQLGGSDNHLTLARVTIWQDTRPAGEPPTPPGAHISCHLPQFAIIQLSPNALPTRTLTSAAQQPHRHVSFPTGQPTCSHAPLCRPCCSACLPGSHCTAARPRPGGSLLHRCAFRARPPPCTSAYSPLPELC